MGSWTENRGTGPRVHCEPPETASYCARRILYHCFGEKSTGNIAGLFFNFLGVNWFKYSRQRNLVRGFVPRSAVRIIRKEGAKYERNE